MKRFAAVLLILVLSVAVVAGFTPTTAAETHVASVRVVASATPQATCQGDFGKDAPILLVHGFDSNPGMWSEGDPSMIRSLSEIPHVAIRTFDYSANHFDWVAHPDIGPKLARTVNCLARESRENGGPGKVIVVAHSMGGLALRYVARWKIDTREIVDDLGLVVTLGTPHKGTLMANVFGWGWRWYCGYLVGDIPNKDAEVRKCEQSGAIAGMKMGSRELAELPEFPSDVPVRAIAGDVTGLTQFFATTLRQPFYGDGVVPLESATAEHEYTTDKAGDGKFVFRCDIRHYDSYGADPREFQGGECWHNAMVKTGYIQESVTNGIRDYLATLDRPTGKPVTVFDDLTFHLPDGMELNAYHGEGPSSYELECEDVAACPAFSVYNPREVGGELGWREWEWDGCGADKPVEAGERRIGDRPATHYLIGHCRVWLMNDNGAFIIAKDPPGKLARVADVILGSAVWKDPN